MNEEIPSKSQRKRDAHQRQDLGESLLELSEAELGMLALPPALLAALREAKSITARGARRRQLQYIGKLMRSIAVEEIEHALSMRQQVQTRQADFQHLLEDWRDRLIVEGDPALQNLADLVPHIDRQHVRQLVRNAALQQRQNKPPQASRALFRYLREIWPAENEAPKKSD